MCLCMYVFCSEYTTVTSVPCFLGNKKEVTSNGFGTDTSPPSVSSVPELQPGAGTLDNAGLVSRDMISVRWALADTTSHLGAQYLSLYSHLYGEFQSAPVQVNHTACSSIHTCMKNFSQHLFRQVALLVFLFTPAWGISVSTFSGKSHRLSLSFRTCTSNFRQHLAR